MKQNKVFTIILIVFIISFGYVGMVSAESGITSPIIIENKEAPSDSYLLSTRRSIGAETEVYTISAPTRGINRSADIRYGEGWTNPFLPGEDGWETGGTGNVGFPIGDVTFPILLSMLLIYFIYRGVSSSRRKSRF